MKLRKEIAVAIETLTERTFNLGGTEVSVKGEESASDMLHANIKLDGKPWVLIASMNAYNLSWYTLKEVHKQIGVEFTLRIA